MFMTFLWNRFLGFNQREAIGPSMLCSLSEPLSALSGSGSMFALSDALCVADAVVTDRNFVLSLSVLTLGMVC